MIRENCLVLVSEDTSNSHYWLRRRTVSGTLLPLLEVRVRTEHSSYDYFAQFDIRHKFKLLLMR